MSPISTSSVLQILCNTVSVTSSSRRRRVMVFGAIPAALRKSDLLIFCLRVVSRVLYIKHSIIRNINTNIVLIVPYMSKLNNGVSTSRTNNLHKKEKQCESFHTANHLKQYIFKYLLPNLFICNSIINYITLKKLLIYHY